MSRSATLTEMRIILASLAMGVAGFSAQSADAQTVNAQNDRRATLGRPIILTIKPRSYLDAGVVVPVGSLSGPASALMQTVLSAASTLQWFAERLERAFSRIRSRTRR